MEERETGTNTAVSPENAAGGANAPDIATLLGGLLSGSKMAQNAAGGANAPDIATLLGGLLSGSKTAQNAAGGANAPDIATLLGGLLSGSKMAQNAAEGTGAPSGMAEGIGAVLRDPDMMAKLPDVIAALAPLMGGGTPSVPPLGAAGQSESGEGSEGTAGGIQAEKSVSASGHARGGGHGRRVALLQALRPYLNPRRREAVDYILKMDRMSGLFRGEK